MSFVGIFEHRIDAKQRLAIPSELREQIDPVVDGKYLFASLIPGPTLALYTERMFNRLAERLDASTRDTKQVLEFEHVFFSLARRLELDGQGRVRLPERLLRMAKLENDVVVIGVKDHMEVHNQASFDQYLESLIKQNPNVLMNPRELLKNDGDGSNGHKQR